MKFSINLTKGLKLTLKGQKANFDIIKSLKNNK